MWIARKPQTIKRGGEYVKVDTGDPIPEADGWPNLRAWVNQGFVKWVVREETPAKVPATVPVDVKEKIKEKIAEVKAEEKPKQSKKSKKSGKKGGDK